jgi:hypothetical protein
MNSSRPLCECGCGQEVNWNYKKKCWRRFLSGHNTIIDNPLRDHPENRLYGKDHPRFGVVGAMKGKPSPKGFLGKHHTNESRDKWMETKAGMDYWWLWGNEHAKKVKTLSEDVNLKSQGHVPGLKQKE